MTAESAERAYLILEDGSVYPGSRFGAKGTAVGEVVFNTSMTGYQEMLTDPSYGGQILMPTYPMIGNYGVNPRDWESGRIQVRGFVVRERCDLPSHPDSTMTVHEYLEHHGIPGIAEVDTRAITRRLRSHGVMMGVITDSPDVSAALKTLESGPRYGEEDVVASVTTRDAYDWDGREEHGEPPPTIETDAARGEGDSGKPSLSASGTGARGGMAPAPGDPRGGARRLRIVVNDLGVKYNILRSLTKRGCDVVVAPASASADEITALKPDGVLLSPGPGDPVMLDRSVASVRALAGSVPIMGICLGHQVVARAFGGSTFKLKFGHRGGNHSVKDLHTGRVYVTAQNHGYAVSEEGLPDELQVTHINLSDGTIEGLRHAELPIMTIQYHSEASPGPLDNDYIFDQFVAMVRGEEAVNQNR